MKNYLNLGGNSNVKFYDYDATSIKIQFSTGAPYIYSYQSAGRENVENMKRLADRGVGLNSFVMRNARKLYVR